MDRKTRALTLSALFAALSIVFLYVASIWPTGQLGFAAAASLFVAAAVIESGLGYGLSVYIAGAALGMLLLPNKDPPLLYVLFFGYYPLLKDLVERIRLKPAQWALKLVVFNAALTVIWYLLKVLVFDFAETPFGIALLYIGGNAVFTLFDIGYSKVIRFYTERVHMRSRV